MKRHMGMAGLVALILHALAATAPAQSVYRKAVTVAPTASLGRPVVAAPVSAAPVSRTAMPAASLSTVGYTTLAPTEKDVRPIASTGPNAPPATLELVAPQAWPAGVYDPNTGSEFAVERPPVRTTVLIPVGGREATGEIPAMLPAPQTTGAPASTGPVGVLPAPAVAVGPTACPADGPCPAEVLPEVGAALAPPPDCSGYFFKGEYLLWWVNGYDVPPLASTSNTADAGILNPGSSTQILFGNGTLNYGALSGARLTAGYWFDCQDAIEVSGFFLGREEESDVFRGTQFGVLARPFFSANRNAPFSQITSFPGEFCGDLTIDRSFSLWGVEANARCNWCCWHSCPCDPVAQNYRVDLLLGARYIDMDERLSFREDIVGLPTASDPFFRNTLFTVSDTFGTRNQFYGGQVGLDAEYFYGRWSLQARGKVALGATHQRIQIDGSQVRVGLDDGSVQNFRGGLLALDGANIGTFTRDRFAVVPELTVTAGYQLLPHVRLFAGYNLLFWSSVVRPGEQIDPVLDTARIPNFALESNPNAQPIDRTLTNTGRPGVPFATSSFWAHGLLLGLEVRY